MEPHLGHVSGVPLGSLFRNRQALHDAGIHRPLQAGIDGNQGGAYSIVVSGGYVDDEDLGSEIIYTGQGGNDPATKRQIADQQWVRGNAALRLNEESGLPIRVIRGYKGDRRLSPAQGYRYDGLFLVDRSWEEVGVDGFRICRFHLVEANELVPEADRDAEPWTPEESGRANAEREFQAVVAKPIRAVVVDHLKPPGGDQTWIVDLIESSAFQASAGKHATPPAGRVQAVLAWLDANGGQLSRPELAAVTEVPESRLAGLVAAVSRCVNLDGYPVLADDGSRVTLDASLARTQFGIA